MKRAFPIIAICLWVLLCFSVIAQQAQQPPQPAGAQAPPKQGDDDLVVAKVQGENITEKQVLSAIDQIAAAQQIPAQQAQQKNTLLFKDAVDNLVNLALLKDEGRQKNLTPDKAKVDEAYDSMVKRFPNQQEFEKALQQQGMTEASLRDSISERQVFQQILDSTVKDVPAATDADVQKFYDDNPQYFAVPEQVHAAHILLRVGTSVTAEQKEQTQKTLEGIRADIEAKKLTFAEAAAKFSQDPSNAQKGGDLGFFGRGQMVKPFEDAAFATEPGSLSSIVETQFGYHLIQVIEKKSAGKASLDEAKDKIRDYLTQNSKQDAIKKHLDELKGKAKVDMFMSEQDWGKRHAK
jgi:peptidyl-prolyl cis-trans isomerase C